MNAVSYLRVSSIGQSDGDGFPRQSDACQCFADAKGHTIVCCFFDVITGSDTVERPGWNAMLAYCKEHGVNTILVEKIDRLQREPIVGELLLIQCREAGISLIDCATGMNFAGESDCPYIRFLQRILRDAAAFNKDMAVHNMGAARARTRKQGIKSDGRKGYRDSPKTPHGPDTIARARRLREQGITYQAIADLFNETNTPTMTNVPWTRGIVHSMLNPKSEYAGAQA